MHKIPRLDRAARRRLIRRAKKANDPHTTGTTLNRPEAALGVR